MSQERGSCIRRVVVTLACLVVVGYPLSYAPVVRFDKARRDAEIKALLDDSGGGFLCFSFVDCGLPPAIGRWYEPLDWMIDNTPMRQPLFWWARVWGVESELRQEAEFRKLIRKLIQRGVPARVSF